MMKEKYMWNVYFGSWGDGRLKRLPYLGYYVLLMVLVFAVIAGTIFLVGSMEDLSGMSMADTQAALLGKFGMLGIAGVIILMFAVMIAQVNILAKRIRDMGLPAVWTILGIVAVSILLNILFPAQHVEVNTSVVQNAQGTLAAFEASSTKTSMVLEIFDTIIFLCLLLIPSDTFKKQNG